MNVTENAEIGTFVIRITSSDLDIGQNANVSYRFTENPGQKFAMDALSGNVTVNGHLDREEQDEYLLKVCNNIYILFNYFSSTKYRNITTNLINNNDTY